MGRNRYHETVMQQKNIYVIREVNKKIMVLKKTLVFMAALIMVISVQCAVFSQSVSAQTQYIYVSTDGNDSNGGTEEAPLATLEAAKQKAVELISENDVVIRFAEGTYPFQKCVSFDGKEFDGTHKVTIQGDGDVVFSGTKKLDISQFQKVSDEKILKRLPESTRYLVGVLDLAKQGVTKSQVDFISHLESGGQVTAPVGVYLNNKKQKLSRWPNSGYMEFEQNDIVSAGARRRWDTSGDRFKGGKWKYNAANPSRWAEAEDACIEGYFGSDYFYEWNPIQSIDPETRTITQWQWTMYGIKAKGRWAATNLLEEIDLPGEWYIDRNTLLMYYYPPYKLDPQEDALELAVMEESFISLNKINGFEISGIHFDKFGNKFAIDIESSSNIHIDGAEFTYTAGGGVEIKRGKNIVIENCLMYYTENPGIQIRNSGNRTTLETSNILIKNNTFYRVATTELHAINLYGNATSPLIDQYSSVGVVITQNTFHGVEAAVWLNGVDCEVSYNEAYNAIRNTADATVMGFGRSWANYGNQWNYNYIHDFGPLNFKNPTYGNYGIFWDDLVCGQTAKGNIIFNNYMNRSEGISIGGGRDHDVEDNIFIKSQQPIKGQDRTNRAGDYTKNDAALAINQLGEDAGLFYAKYPTSGKYLIEDIIKDNGFIPKNNTIKNNFGVDVGGFSIAERFVQNGTVENNVETSDYSVFVDPENQDFRVTDEAKEKYGLSEGLPGEDFDINSIGTQTKLEKTGDKFFLTSPVNGAKDTTAQNIEFYWEEPLFADQYRFELAEDKNFEKIVEDKIVYNNYYSIEQLENNKSYYWRVTAYSIGRGMENEWKCVGDGYLFTTVKFDNLYKDVLLEVIDEAKAFSNEIVEQSAGGRFFDGTKERLLSAIDNAEKTSKLAVGTQKQIDTEISSLRAALYTAKTSKTIIYKQLNLNDNIKWIAQGTKPLTVKEQMGGLEVSAKDVAGYSFVKGSANEDECAMLCFGVKAEWKSSSWWGLAARVFETTDSATTIFNGRIKDYYVVIKNHQFELQSQTAGEGTNLYIEYPNNGIIVPGKWYEIQFGAVPVGNDILVIFKVNGETVIEYLDKNSTITEGGKFAIQPMSEGSVSLRPAENVPEEIFVYDSGIVDRESLESVSIDELEDGQFPNKKLVELNYNGNPVKISSESGEYKLRYDGKKLILTRTEDNNTAVLAIKSCELKERDVIKIGAVKAKDNRVMLVYVNGKNVIDVTDEYCINGELKIGEDR